MSAPANPLHSLALRYRFTFPLLARLPSRLAYRLATAHAKLQVRAHLGDRAVFQQQMRRVFPGRPEAEVQRWLDYHFGMVHREILDTWKFPRIWHSPAAAEFFRIKGQEPLLEARRDGRRVILTGGHYNRLWSAPVALQCRGVSVGTMARDGRQENVFGLPEEEHRYRLKKLATLKAFLGPFFIEGDYLGPLYRALDEHVIAILFDVPYRADEARRIPVPFLGKTGYFPAGLARIAKKADALLFPFFVSDSRDGLTVDILPALDPRSRDEEEIVSALVRELEQRVLQQPAQWWLWPALPILWGEV